MQHGWEPGQTGCAASAEIREDHGLRSRGLAALIVALGLAAAACSPSGGVANSTAQTTTSPPSSTSPPSIWSFARPDDDPILRVHVQGMGTSQLPELVMYADGSVVVPDRAGVTPILIPFMRLIASEAELERVNDLVGEMRLREIHALNDLTLKDQGLIDAATTVVTYFDENGVSHTYGVYGIYALGEGAVAGSAALAEFIAMFEGAAEGERVEPGRIQLYWAWADSDNRETVSWPLDVVPDDFILETESGRRCLVVTGSAASDAADILENTRPSVTFEYEDDERSRELGGHILFPGEDACGPEYSD